MDRRSFLATVVGGATLGTAGCAGRRVLELRPTGPIRVKPNWGWIREIPAAANRLTYVAHDEQPFDVYVFTDEQAVGYYRTFIEGGDPPETPSGDRTLSNHAHKVGTDGGDPVYEASTPDKERAAIDGDGPAYFVLDNSNYRMENPVGEQAAPLSVSLDLTATKNPLPV